VRVLPAVKVRLIYGGRGRRAEGVGVSVVNTYQIFGKPEALRAGGRFKDRMFIGARWQNSDWYFSLPGIMTVD